MTGPIAFVGTGNMGRPMAEQLLSAGFALRVYNRSTAKVAGLVERGAVSCASAAEAASGAELLVTMLADDAALRQTAIGDEGFLTAMAPGTLHISMSTVSPAVNRWLLGEHRSRGADLVAAPVMGRPDVAAAGQLFIVAAGRADLEERCRPSFAALGRGHTWLGEDPGLANVAKIGLNFMLATIVELAAEVFALVEKHDLPPERFFELAKMMLPAPAFEGYARRMLDGRFQPAGFAAALGAKDVGLALGLAEAGPAPSPLASTVRDRLLATIARGRGDWDMAALGVLARESAGLA